MDILQTSEALDTDHRPEAQGPRPQVSWLLCTHQNHPLLARAIASCLGQTMADFELLIVVNGKEATQIAATLRQQYASDARVRVVQTPLHLLNFSLSLGLHLARAPYVARMDADDVSSPERLQRQLAFMQQHPEVAVLGSAYSLVDSQGQIHGHVSPPEHDRESRTQLRWRNRLCHPSGMLRKSAILPLGGYLGGRNAEDYDLWLRLALDSQWQFANLHERLLSYNMALDGAARRSRAAYAHVAAAQLRNFLVSGDPRWLLGACLTAGKSLLRASRG